MPKQTPTINPPTNAKGNAIMLSRIFKMISSAFFIVSLPRLQLLVQCSRGHTDLLGNLDMTGIRFDKS